MSKKIIVSVMGVAVVVVIAGILLLVPKFSKKDSTAQKNIAILQSEKNMPIVSQEVAYFKEVKGYFVKPKDEGMYPGIVMIHENRGLRPEIKMAAEQLAKDGYMVLAVNLLGGVAEDQEGARALTGAFKQEDGVANMRAAVAYLRAQGVTKVASLGWCFGGKQSLELALSGEKLDATVVYYGGGMATTTDRLAALQWPVLGIFGDKDQVIPLSMVEAFKTSLTTLGIKHEVYVYPGVGHAFANPSGMNYAANETKDAWGKTLAFLKTTLQ